MVLSQKSRLLLVLVIMHLKVTHSLPMLMKVLELLYSKWLIRKNKQQMMDNFWFLTTHFQPRLHLVQWMQKLNHILGLKIIKNSYLIWLVSKANIHQDLWMLNFRFQVLFLLLRIQQLVKTILLHILMLNVSFTRFKCRFIATNLILQKIL